MSMLGEDPLAVDPAEPATSEQMLRDELAHVLGDPAWHPADLASAFSRLHEQPDGLRPSALCLSGGGIRSATFSLGVLQWLASQGRLGGFHYLSTVSGGGYIGSWLVNGLWQAGQPLREAARAQAKRRIDAAEQAAEAARASVPPPGGQPAGPARPATAAPLAVAEARLAWARQRAEVLRRRATTLADRAAADWLRRVGQSAGCAGAAAQAGAAPADGAAPDPVAPLRAMSNYLSPTGGLSGDAFSLAAIFVRNLLLNALIWVAVLSSAVALPRLYLAWLNLPAVPDALALGTASASALLVLLGVAYVVADLPAPRNEPPAATRPSAPARRAQAADDAKRTEPADRFTRWCFLPITLAAAMLSLGGAWSAEVRNASWWWFAGAGALAHLLGVLLGVAWRLRRGLQMRPRNDWGLFVIVAVGAAGGALAAVALSQLGAGPGDGGGAFDERQRLLYASLAVPGMTAAFWLAMALYAGLMSRKTDEQDREWWARATGYWLRFTFGWLAVFGLVVWLPLAILTYLGSSGPTALQFGIGGGVLGVLTSLIGYWSKSGGEIRRKAQGFLRLTRIRLLDAMAALVLLATLLALSLAWNAVLDSCHGWRWTSTLCPAELAQRADFLRQQTALRAAQAQRGPAAPADAAATRAAAEAAAAARAAEGQADGDDDAPEPAAARVYQLQLVEAPWPMLTICIAALLGAAAILAWAMGVNHFSLHGMYGNRLVRAYLGSGRPRRRPHWFTGFDPDDNIPLAQLGAPLRGSDGRPRLYPVLGMALNIVHPSPRHLDWQQRKAASFIATPRHCGAANVGYRPTANYGGGMTLGRALTISGAAASPNMGYHSSPLVTFVMTLFNVRLGWWSPNPGPDGNAVWRLGQPALGLEVAIAEARGSTRDTDPYVYLSDGGHFDNTGIYEMVRRRCHRIVAVDATCDGEFRWLDLLDVVRKIRVDFGIPIDLPAVLPGSGRDSTHARWLEAPIRYSARDGNPPEQDGLLVVLKPRLLPATDPPELQAYAAISVPAGTPADSPARFPHQTTADQFFDEQQFESYRMLGFLTAAQALDARPVVAVAAARRLGRRQLATTGAATAAAAGRRDGDPADRDGEPLAAGVAGASGATGLAHLVQQFGSGAVLATALTVGGTLGVAGTVALAPLSTLSLSDADRALLREGLALRVQGADLKLDALDRALLDRGITIRADASVLDGPADRLDKAAGALQSAAVKLAALQLAPPASAADGRVTVTLDPALTQALAALRTDVAALRDRIRVAAPAASASDEGDLTSSLVALRRTLVAIEQRLPSDPTLAKALTDLKKAVEDIAPRRNVRGQEGGAR